MNQYFITIVTFCLLCLTRLTNAQGIIKDDFLVNDDAGIESQMYPSISMDAAGNFVVVWRDFRNGNGDIYYQKFTSNGSALGFNIIVNDDTGSASQGYNSISMDGAGNFVIVWDDYRNTNYDSDIYFQRYTSTGAILGINTRINDDIDSVKQWFPSIAMETGGNFVVAWTDERNGNSDIYFQRYTGTGIALGANTKVNDDAGSADQISPSILMNAAGDFVIVWQDLRNANWDIYFQRYTGNGAALGANIKVNDDAVNESQYHPSISMDAAGNFVIVWQDYRNNNWDIYYQIYTGAGTTLGVNTKVNDAASNTYQKVPSITMNAVGDFVIVWEDYRYGQTNPDIFGQKFFANGYPDGGNYRIVADGPNNGESLPVLFANDSDIIFCWMDNRRSQGWDIYAKIVSWNWNGVTEVIDKGNNNPEVFSLFQNYPNPFNPGTKISWQSPVSCWQTLKIYDILGKEIATLVDEFKPAGIYEIEFNASSNSGNLANLTSGIYFYQLKATPSVGRTGSYLETKKMLLLK